MVNTDDFIKRLEKVFEYYNLTASSFADKIGVQRSSLSHLLSGRNKPSLDFILKVTEEFPEIDLYWILNGKGNFPKSNETKSLIASNDHPTSQIQSDDLFSVNQEKRISDNTSENNVLTNTSVNENKIEKKSNIENLNQTIDSDENIEHIVVFYKDGTFRKYKPK